MRNQRHSRSNVRGTAAVLVVLMCGGLAGCSDSPRSKYEPLSKTERARRSKATQSQKTVVATPPRSVSKTPRKPRQRDERKLIEDVIAKSKRKAAEARPKFSTRFVKNVPRNPPPDAIMQAWKAAGAEFEWRGNEDFVIVRFSNAIFYSTVAVPQFRFSHRWKPTANLPDPAVPFSIYAQGVPVTDSDLKQIARLRSVKYLDLARTQITDAGLKELANLENVKWLNLGGTKMTGTGLKELAGLKNLRSLTLYEAGITDEGLKGFAQLKTCISLFCSAPK
jgi:hypothetical protein